MSIDIRHSQHRSSDLVPGGKKFLEWYDSRLRVACMTNMSTEQEPVIMMMMLTKVMIIMMMLMTKNDNDDDDDDDEW